MLYKCLTCSRNSVFLWRHAQDSLINVFRTRMCGQTLLFIVIANCAIMLLNCFPSSLSWLPRNKTWYDIITVIIQLKKCQFCVRYLHNEQRESVLNSTEHVSQTAYNFRADQFMHYSRWRHRGGPDYKSIRDKVQLLQFAKTVTVGLKCRDWNIRHTHTAF